MLIFLIGYMGSGKTTLGREMARRIGSEFIDTDTLIEQNQGCSTSTIFVEQGEARFRELEREAILTLDKDSNFVVSTGGGLPCFGSNMELINELGFTIYLKIPIKVLVLRLIEGRDKRPLLRNKSKDELVDYVTENLILREPFYSKAKMTITGSNIKVDDIIQLMNNI